MCSALASDLPAIPMSGFSIDFADTPMEIERPKFTTRANKPTIIATASSQNQQNQRKVIVTSRGAKQNDGEKRVSFNTSSLTAAAATPNVRGFVVSAASNGGGKRSVAKKRSNVDVTTFTRTITNDDMADDPDPTERQGNEAAPKRGKVGGRGETLPASAGPVFALPTPAPVPTLSRVQAAGGQPDSKRPAAVASAPTVIAPTPAPMQISSGKGPRVTVLLRNLAPGVDGTLLGKQILGIFNYDSIVVDTDPSTHACLGTAEVLFEHEVDALEAVQLCQGQLILGKPVRMSILREKEQVETPQEKDEREKREREREQRRKEQMAQQTAQQQAPHPKQATHVPKSVPLYAPSAAVATSFPLASPTVSFSVSSHVASFPAATSTATTAGPIISSQPLNQGFSWSNEVDGARVSGGVMTQAAPLNQPFIWGNPRDDADAAVQLNGAQSAVADVIFNITNLGGARALNGGGAASSSHQPIAQPKRLEVKPKSGVVSSAASAVNPHAEGGAIRPKSVVLSGSDAMAGVKRLTVVPKGASAGSHPVAPAATRPSITLSKRG